jgi:hypothetical protein
MLASSNIASVFGALEWSSNKCPTLLITRIMIKQKKSAESSFLFACQQHVCRWVCCNLQQVQTYGLAPVCPPLRLSPSLNRD